VQFTRLIEKESKPQHNKLMPKKILFILGTRPEAIKLAPIIQKFQSDSADIIRVCITGQHKHMVSDILSFFHITPDHDLRIMEDDQSLFDITIRVLTKLEPVLKSEKPEWVIVQGDTTSAFCGALAAYYLKIPVAHVEAGLRTYNSYAPYPEELNRKWISSIAHLHFAPTETAKENLLKENIQSPIHVVGNSVIDALLWTLNQKINTDQLNHIDFSKKMILMTCHRRENKGQGRQQILEAARHIATKNPDVSILYLTHPNTRQDELKIENIHYLAPLEYPEFIFLLNKSHIVLTDSGGLQEEAAFLGKPTIVTREVTERTEGVKNHNAIVTGTDSTLIEKELQRLLDDRQYYKKMSLPTKCYGVGTTSQSVVSVIKN
jgi:UDP-N-acetylglucosamine 2-epimerase (non-hydrolysing)